MEQFVYIKNSAGNTTIPLKGASVLKLVDLLNGTDLQCPEELKDLEITGIAYNSQWVTKGNVFICMKGYHTDGHIYALDAAFKGASIIISEENIGLKTIPVLKVADSRKILSKISANFYEDSENPLLLYGVTGTNGKTTICYMIKSIIESSGLSCGILGTIGYCYGKKAYEAVNTTPESCELQRMFAEMRAEGIENCVMEVSSHALAMGRVDHIKFHYGIFSNLTPDHMDFHSNSEDYFEAKKKLFYMTEKANIINLDDEYGRRLYDEVSDRKIVKTIGFSLKDKKADYFGDILETTERGSKIRVLENSDELGILKINTPGIFTIYNGMAGLACARMAGFSFHRIQMGMEALKGVPGRFELVENNKGYIVIVDYAHTPDALEKVLKTASDFNKGRLLCVFGCGGDRDKKKRSLMGAVAGKYSDFCIITSDNPRTEKQEDIAFDVEKGIYETGCNYEIINDRYEAIKKIVSIYKKGDIIMIAGKGHENYQILGTKKTYFDDKEVAKKIIENGE